MKTSSLIKPKLVSFDSPVLDSRLGGGLQRGEVTELIGLPDVARPIIGRLIEHNMSNDARVGVIDYVHDLLELGIPLRELYVLQPSSVQKLPVLLEHFVRNAFDLVLINLGSEVWFENQIPRSAVDDDLRFALAQIDVTLQRSNPACLVCAEGAIMPGDPTVIRLLCDRSDKRPYGLTVSRPIRLARDGSLGTSANSSGSSQASYALSTSLDTCSRAAEWSGKHQLRDGTNGQL